MNENIKKEGYVVRVFARFYKPVSQETKDWNEERQMIKHKGRRCNECCYDWICEGPWEEYTEHFGDLELEPVCIDSNAITRLLSKIIRIT